MIGVQGLGAYLGFRVSGFRVIGGSGFVGLGLRASFLWLKV